jgi:aerotaxis receptor
MKINTPVTDKEVKVKPDQQLISSTNLKGMITHCNQAFVEISGFDEDELIGSSHNIVRHPDMPPAAFQELWDTLKAGKAWMGIVKNRTKNGDYYWVDAYVTPVFENDEIVGYESVRFAPRTEDVQRADALYKKLSNNRRSLLGGLNLSLNFKISMLLSVALAAIFTTLAVSGQLSWSWSILTWLVSATMTTSTVAYMLSPLRGIADNARDIFSSSVNSLVYSGRTDDLGAIRLGQLSQLARLRTVLGRITDSVSTMDARAAQGRQVVTEMTGAVDSQQHEISMLAAAMEEMSTSVSEVSRNASDVSSNARAARSLAEQGKKALEGALSSTQRVASEVDAVAEMMVNLEQSSVSIDAVLVVIREIAEQTNLLALNAAIEAARAGEQGRGFAVVADEVRTLAKRSHDSTEEIQKTIEQLQANARNAAEAMRSSRQVADNSAEQSDKVGQQLDEIFSMVEQLDAMNQGIATVVEEQSSVTGEIAQNVNRISDSSMQLKKESEVTASLSEDIHRMSLDLDNLIRRFRS